MNEQTKDREDKEYKEGESDKFYKRVFKYKKPLPKKLKFK